MVRFWSLMFFGKQKFRTEAAIVLGELQSARSCQTIDPTLLQRINSITLLQSLRTWRLCNQLLLPLFHRVRGNF